MIPIYGDVAGSWETLCLSASGPPEELTQLSALVGAMTPHFKPNKDTHALETALTWPAVVQCAYTFASWWRPSEQLQQWIQHEGMRRMTLPALEYPVPDHGLTPYAHQNAGAAMIKATGRVLLTDDPGTGKTITAILGLSELLVGSLMRGELSPEPVLVIAPASVVDPWVEAVKLWAPHWRVTAYRGGQRRNKLGGYDVYVTSYDVARIDAPSGRHGPLSRLGARSVVIDECHYIKNPGAARSKAVVRLGRDAPFVIAMSGTPITHHTGNLTPALEAMDAHAWPSGERFKERYLLTDDGSGYAKKVVGLNGTTEPEFRDCLEGQMRRVAKEDVLDLPPKVYSTRVVEMPAAYRKAYEDFERTMIAQLPGGTELAVMDVFTVLTHLKALACAPADARYETRLVLDTDPDSPTYGEEIEKTSVHLDLKAPSWKVTELVKVIEERELAQGIVFAPSKQLIELAGDAAARAGARVGYIVGGQSARQRTAVIDAFQAGELDIVLATTGAGGVGITLTAASYVVFLQRPLSLVEATQAEDRAHRIGQTNESVEIIDILTADTVDTRIREILREHAGQLAELVQDPRIVQHLLGGHNPAHDRTVNAA